MSGDTVAERLFSAMMAHSVAEQEAVDALLSAVGVDPEDPNNWPLSDITFDDYDGSFEFKGIRGDWVPTVEQLAACFALGFSRCWLCYADDTEVYAWETKDHGVSIGARVLCAPHRRRNKS